MKKGGVYVYIYICVCVWFSVHSASDLVKRSWNVRSKAGKCLVNQSIGSSGVDGERKREREREKERKKERKGQRWLSQSTSKYKVDGRSQFAKGRRGCVRHEERIAYKNCK